MTKTVEQIRQEAVADVLQQQARQDALDAMYFAAGRDNPMHELHSRYTGLAQSRS